MTKRMLDGSEIDLRDYVEEPQIPARPVVEEPEYNPLPTSVEDVYEAIRFYNDPDNFKKREMKNAAAQMLARRIIAARFVLQIINHGGYKLKSVILAHPHHADWINKRRFSAGVTIESRPFAPSDVALLETYTQILTADVPIVNHYFTTIEINAVDAVTGYAEETKKTIHVVNNTALCMKDAFLTMQRRVDDIISRGMVEMVCFSVIQFPRGEWSV